MTGLGTILNVVAILVGSTLGVAFGNRLSERTTRTVTDGIGLVVIVLGGLNVASLRDQAYVDAVGPGITLLVVLASILAGGIVGSLLRIEQRLESLGAGLQRRFASKEGDTSSARARFIEGFVDASLIFVIGPLAVLGAISDGLGRGIEQLALKSVLDGFTSLAFASSLGWGVAASVLPVGVWQGAITIAAAFVGALLPAAYVSAMTATGGVLLLGVGLRLLHVKPVPVGDLLPALVFAPAFTALIVAFAG